jgi:AcrR family transcriptional regulator
MLDAAAKLFSTRGYVDTGIDDIGEAVGVTGPAVYRHFKSKEALLVAVLASTTSQARR